MINKLLHALSNRKKFQESMFRSDPGFSPALLSEENLMLRQLLFLDVSDTDYYLKIYLGLLHAYPDIEANFQDDVRTYDVEDFGIKVVKVDGGDFLSALPAGFYTDPISNHLPVWLRYQIRYDLPGYVRLLNQEAQVVRRSRFNLSADSKIMHVDWPEDFPFTGPLKIPSPWTTGSAINIQVEPRHFPYEEMAQRLSSNVYLMRLISEASLVDEYVNTRDIQRKVAIALAVVAANNPSVYA
jgi:hypothetical protein